MKRSARKTLKRKIDSASHLSTDQRQNYIKTAAYYLAEKNNFDSEFDVDNWLTAEAEIDRLLAKGK